MNSLIRLKHILAVARCGSFSVAAEEVGISQPALTRSIQAFEQEYGLRLFDRGTGGTTLTPAGTLAVEHARTLLMSATDFDREMRMFGKGNAGRTGVGLGPMMASLILPRLGVAVLEQSPHLTLVTRIGPPDTMLEALLNGTIELIVGNAWQVGLVPGVVEEQLGALPLAMVVRAQHPLARSGKLTMRELEAFPSARTFDHAPSQTANSSGAFVCEHFDILRQLALGTNCSWLVSPRLITRELEQGTLVELEIEDLPIPETQTSLVYLRGRTRSPASILVADLIRSTIAALQE